MNIIERLDIEGFAPCILDEGVECGFFTPAGEDFNFIIHGKSKEQLKESFRQYAESFDIDEHIEPWIPRRGENGVPESISELVEDAQWIRNTLLQVADKL